MSGPSLDNDACFPNLPPLPEGWDWARYRSMSTDELEALPEDLHTSLREYRDTRTDRWLQIRPADVVATRRASLLQMRRLDLMPYHPDMTKAERKAQRKEEKARDFLTSEELAVVEHYGMPKEQVGTPLFEIADVMYRHGCVEEWGFWAFRTWGYGDPVARARWEEFSGRWNEMMGDRLRRLVVDGMVNTGLKTEEEGFEEKFTAVCEEPKHWGIVQKWALLLFQKEPMEGMEAEGVRDIFREFLKSDRAIALGLQSEEDAPDGTVPPGIDADLCFMIDEGVVSSLLDQRPGKRPYIIGILSDLDLDFDEDEDDDDDDDDDEEIPGDDEVVQFKIALESVVDLWRQCWVQDVKELVPPPGKIYISPGVWEDDD